MGLLSKENKNTLVDLSDMIDPDSIKVNIYDDDIFIPLIKELPSWVKKSSLAAQQSHVETKIMHWVKANDYSWTLSLNGISKFATEVLRLKGTKRGKVYDITSRINYHPWLCKKQLCIHLGEMSSCIISVMLEQDLPLIDGFVKVYKDGTFKCGQ